MTQQILGPSGSPRRRWTVFVPLLVAFALGLFYIAGAQAVHDDGLFQLDGNAVGGVAAGPNDWNNINPPPNSTTASATSFVTDLFNTGNDNIMTGGSTKDDLNINGGPGNGWLCKQGTTVDKNDIEHAFAAAYSGPDKADPGTDPDLYLYFGADKYSVSGDAQIGFWFFKGTVGCTAPATGSAAFTGTHQVGDILILSDFSNGGSVSTIRAFEWVGPGNGDTNDTLDLLATSQDCDATVEPPELCAQVNPLGNETTGGWTYQQKANLVGAPPQADLGKYPKGAFYEGGINLTSFLGPAADCFSTFMAETRQSTSVSSVLEDFALGSFALCDLKISIAGTATNEVGQQHTFTVNVQKKSAGTGFVPLAGAHPTVVITPTPGANQTVTDNCATGTGTDANGNCTVILTSTVAGVFTANASVTATFGGSTFTRDTNSTTPAPCGGGTTCGPAVKTFVDANIQIGPSGTNGINEAHTFTGHVNVNPGTGFVNAPAGTVITFAIVSGPGSFVGGATCATVGTTGSCTKNLTSAVAGTTVVSASTMVSVGGLTLSRTTNGVGANSGNATKVFVAGTLRWLKHDQNAALLAGATFEVCRTHDRFGVDITDECVSVPDNTAPDADPTGGEFQLNDLVLGRYTIRETAAPAGYQPDPDTVTVELTLENPSNVLSAPIFVNVQQFKLIVITCNQASNDLVVSAVTLNGTTLDTIGAVPASLLGKTPATTQAEICNIGGASYGNLNAGTYGPSVVIPKPTP
jgi:hypothetical protein